MPKLKPLNKVPDFLTETVRFGDNEISRYDFLGWIMSEVVHDRNAIGLHGKLCRMSETLLMLATFRTPLEGVIAVDDEKSIRSYLDPTHFHGSDVTEVLEGLGWNLHEDDKTAIRELFIDIRKLRYDTSRSDGFASSIKVRNQGVLGFMKHEFRYELGRNVKPGLPVYDFLREISWMLSDKDPCGMDKKGSFSATLQYRLNEAAEDLLCIAAKGTVLEPLLRGEIRPNMDNLLAETVGVLCLRSGVDSDKDYTPLIDTVEQMQKAWAESRVRDR